MAEAKAARTAEAKKRKAAKKKQAKQKADSDPTDAAEDAGSLVLTPWGGDESAEKYVSPLYVRLRGRELTDGGMAELFRRTNKVRLFRLVVVIEGLDEADMESQKMLSGNHMEARRGLPRG